MVKLFQLGSAEFTAEPELMLAHGVRGDVGEMSGDVLAALRRSQADAIEAGNLNIRRTGEVEAVVKIEPVAGQVKVGVEVAEDLPEIVHTGKQLVGNLGGKCGIPSRRVIRHVDGSNFVVILQLRSGLSQRRASDRRDLVSLADEIVKGNVVLVVEFVIYFRQAVVAVAKFRVRTRVIIRCGGSRL